MENNSHAIKIGNQVKKKKIKFDKAAFLKDKTMRVDNKKEESHP